jgi:RF-1 domain
MSPASETGPMIRTESVLRLSDSKLLAECEVHTYRASGPGGQNRNKVESAVRICHMPTGVSAIAEDSRSQLENRPLALRRLREAIAVRVRSPVNRSGFVPPSEWIMAVEKASRLRVSERNPAYPILVAAVLDVLDACQGRVSEAAELLGISTHHVVQFLGDHSHPWQEANRIRQRHGQKQLRKLE